MKQEPTIYLASLDNAYNYITLEKDLTNQSSKSRWTGIGDSYIQWNGTAWEYYFNFTDGAVSGILTKLIPGTDVPASISSLDEHPEVYLSNNLAPLYLIAAGTGSIDSIGTQGIYRNSGIAPGFYHVNDTDMQLINVNGLGFGTGYYIMYHGSRQGKTTETNIVTGSYDDNFNNPTGGGITTIREYDYYVAESDTPKNKNIQIVTKDNNSDFKEHLLDLTADTATPKSVRFSEFESSPVLTEAYTVLLGSFTGDELRCNLLTRGNKISIPTGQTYSLSFDVLAMDADFSVSRWQGRGTVQNTGGIVSGVGSIHYRNGEVDWNQDGIGTEESSPIGPGEEISDLKLLWDTDSEDCSFYAYITATEPHPGMTIQAIITIQKIIASLPSAYSSSSPATPTINEDAWKIFNFTSTIYSEPTSLIINNDNTLMYGLLKNSSKGSSSGAIYSIKLDGSEFTVLKELRYLEEGSIHEDMILVDNTLYCLSRLSPNSSNNGGTISSLNLLDNSYTIVCDFLDYFPQPISARKIIYAANRLWVIGDNDVLCSVLPNGTDFQTNHIFGTGQDGINPTSFIYSSETDDILYITCSRGGEYGGGCISRYNITTSTYNVLLSFDKTIHGTPFGDIGSDQSEYLYLVLTDPYSTIVAFNKNDSSLVIKQEFNNIPYTIQCGVGVNQQETRLYSVGQKNYSATFLSLESSTYTGWHEIKTTQPGIDDLLYYKPPIHRIIDSDQKIFGICHTYNSSGFIYCLPIFD